MRTAPKIVSGSNWHQINPPWVVSGGRWHQCSQVYVVQNSQWRMLFDYIDLPANSNGWVQKGGRGGSIPGVIWGSTSGYCFFNLRTVKPVVGIQIEINVNKPEGSYHGSGGNFNVSRNGGSIQWRASGHSGLQTSPVISCSFNAGEQIKVWCYGNDDNGDGKLIDWVRIVNVIYG